MWRSLWLNISSASAMPASSWGWTAQAIATNRGRIAIWICARRWKALARQNIRYGYRRLWAILTRRGWKVNIKHVYRLYKDECLSVPRLKRKRLARLASANPLLVRPNQEWALDFVSDSLASGRGIRALTIIDCFTRESPAIEVSTGISSQQVTRVLERVIEQRGAPDRLRVDNGPEFTSRHLIAWCEERKITIIHIQPGKPMQNGVVESFNGRFRDECLNANWFLNLADARQKIEAWRIQYNTVERFHTAVWRIGRQKNTPNSALSSPAGWAPSHRTARR